MKDEIGYEILENAAKPLNASLIQVKQAIEQFQESVRELESRQLQSNSKAFDEQRESLDSLL